MATTYISASPKNPDSEKSKRYDRQLRYDTLFSTFVCLLACFNIF